MRKLGLLVGMVGVLSVPTLQATMQVTLVDNTSKYSYNNGGEFRAVANADLYSKVNWGAYSTVTKGMISLADGGSWGYSSGLNDKSYFQTFCIEYNEEFYPGTTYNVTISDKALWGSQQTEGGDPISIGTAYLYSQFAKGTLDGYIYGSGRTASAGDLQKAIWWLEGEANGVHNSYVDLAESELFKNDTTIMNDANGAYGVKALNLGTPGNVQDQLVIVPEPTTMIAGALLLLPFGVSTIRMLRNRRTA